MALSCCRKFWRAFHKAAFLVFFTRQSSTNFLARIVRRFQTCWQITARQTTLSGFLLSWLLEFLRSYSWKSRPGSTGIDNIKFSLAPTRMGVGWNGHNERMKRSGTADLPLHGGRV